MCDCDLFHLALALEGVPLERGVLESAKSIAYGELEPDVCSATANSAAAWRAPAGADLRCIKPCLLVKRRADLADLPLT